MHGENKITRLIGGQLVLEPVEHIKTSFEVASVIAFEEHAVESEHTEFRIGNSLPECLLGHLLVHTSRHVVGWESGVNQVAVIGVSSFRNLLSIRNCIALGF